MPQVFSNTQDISTVNAFATFVPIALSGEMRVVLTWNKHPYDLDLYVSRVNEASPPKLPQVVHWRYPEAVAPSTGVNEMVSIRG